MEKRTRMSPDKVLVSPDQPDVTVKFNTNVSGDIRARIFVRDTPDGIEVEKVGRNQFEVSWTPPLREKAIVTFAEEGVAGSTKHKLVLNPNLDELAAYDAAQTTKVETAPAAPESEEESDSDAGGD